MTQSTDVQPGQAIFLRALSTHVWCFAASAAAVAGAAVCEIKWLAVMLAVFGVTSAVGFIFVLYKDVRSQDKLLDAHLARHSAVTISINPPPAPAAPAPLEPRKIPSFAPVSFVEFIWSHRQSDGSFPTVETCVREGQFRQNKVQEWYTNIVAAGYIGGRIPFQSSGKPILNRERFIQAAKDHMTMWDGK